MQKEREILHVDLLEEVSRKEDSVESFNIIVKYLCSNF